MSLWKYVTMEIQLQFLPNFSCQIPSVSKLPWSFTTLQCLEYPGALTIGTCKLTHHNLMSEPKNCCQCVTGSQCLIGYEQCLFTNEYLILKKGYMAMYPYLPFKRFRQYRIHACIGSVVKNVILKKKKKKACKNLD